MVKQALYDNMKTVVIERDDPKCYFLAGVTRHIVLPTSERDELGSDLVPDYMTSVKDGAFYG